MRGMPPYFIDTGAWVALAVEGDPYHERAAERWKQLNREPAKRFTSIPIVLETFTFLDRNTDRQTALLWKEEVLRLPRFEILECTLHDLERSWSWFNRKELHKLSAIDATSFAIMERRKLSYAFTFDTHFSLAGFNLI